MAASHDFEDWLCNKLKSLQLDEDVFLDYIKGVLEEDVPEEEKSDTISNILEGAIVSVAFKSGCGLYGSFLGHKQRAWISLINKKTDRQRGRGRVFRVSSPS